MTRGALAAGQGFAPANQAGYSFIELAVAVVVIGILAGAAYTAYSPRAGGREAVSALARGEVVSEAIRSFALHNHRLPCPDTDGDGREGDASGSCAAGVELGWVPYESIGMQRPTPSAREVYAVFRRAAASADLVAPATTPTRNDLIRSLTAAAAIAPSSAHVYLTGDGQRTGSESCSSNAVMHPAFAVVVPNGDADGDGSFFDGVNSGLPGSGRCLASPSTPARNGYDDAVVMTGIPTLIGLSLDDVP